MAGGLFSGSTGGNAWPAKRVAIGIIDGSSSENRFIFQKEKPKF